jgi:hypothetical protein
MREGLRRRPSPALVISFVALLVAISGTASALPGRNQVKRDDIAANAVRSSDIKAKNVRSSDVASGAIGSSDLANGSVGNSQLAPTVANETLTSGSRVTMTFGQAPRTLLDNGTFKLVASCENGGGIKALIRIDTTQAGSAYASLSEGGQSSKASFGPGLPADPDEQVIVGVISAGGDIAVSTFSAWAPNGASLSGTALASDIGGGCQFAAFGVS